MEHHESPSRAVQYLTFFIAGEEYAVGILRTREIVEYGMVTKVPSVPACVRGVINLRGSVVPVIDLAIKFEFGRCTITKWSCIVIVEVELDGERAVMGILVDAIGQVVDLLPQDIAPPPAFGTNVRVDYLQGMGTSGQEFVLLLDIGLVLSELELAVNPALDGQTHPALQAPEACAALTAAPPPGEASTGASEPQS